MLKPIGYAIYFRKIKQFSKSYDDTLRVFPTKKEADRFKEGFAKENRDVVVVPVYVKQGSLKT